MKLAIIGNSHLGSLKRAWDKISGEYPSVTIVFFGVRGDAMKDLAIEGRRLVPQTDLLRSSLKFTADGREAIDLDEFDALLIYGIGDAGYYRARDVFFSRQALKRAMEDLIRGRPFFKILKMTDGAFDRPIYIGSQPLPAADRNSGSQSVDAYIHGADLINKTVYGPIGARLITQPVETMVNGRNTDIKYTKGARIMAVGDRMDDKLHREEDIFHMNDEYGELWLRKFFSELKVEAKPAIVASAALK